MKKVLVIISLIFVGMFSFAQKAEKIINAKEVLRIESFLSSDDLKGRKPGTPEMEKAADFIANEFKKAGLKNMNGLTGYKQNFTNIRSRFLNAVATIDTNKIDENNIIAITTDSIIKINETSGYKKVVIGNTDNLLQRAEEIINAQSNQLVLVNSFFLNDFKKLRRFKRDGVKTKFSVVFILSNNTADKYDIEIKHKISSTNYSNVVAVLPGKSRKNEIVVFSGHYDHLGVGKPNAVGDSIYNGANDDAAGTTAVIMLANYFAKLKSNERTLMFVAFTAEETGGYGSQYFSKQLDADKVVAMFNLEMIGTESKWGKNSAYITGFEKSDFGKILQNNLSGSAFRFEPDPYPKENLFYRSDNATLAALGVPAHTISTSKMDNEPTYHKQSDDITSIDIDNMTEIIKAIALSSKTIISGKDTPTRVEKK
jgi:Zn-dependent M28 family amino/carboxypeptidase